MRPVTRNLVLGLLAVGGLLLALGALPGYLRAGDPYYVTASPAEPDRATVPGEQLSERRYPYVHGALADADGPGRSAAYWRGPLGVKDAFTHSPFDEFAALSQQYPNASTDGTVYLRTNGTTYRLAIVQADGP